MDLKDEQVLTGRQVVHCQGAAVRRAPNVVSRVYKFISILNNRQLICQQS